MAKKVYRIDHLDCAHCAARIEEKINAMEAVEEATIVFPTRQLRVTAEDPDSLLEDMRKVAQSVEFGVEIGPWDDRKAAHSDDCCTCCGHDHHGEHCHDHHDHCDCDHHGHDHHDHCDCDHHGHDHHDHHDHDHSHDGHDHKDMTEILCGAGLFALGLLISWLVPQTKWYLVLFFGAYLVLGLDVLKIAVKNMFRGHMLDENFLMTVATLGAFAIGEFPEAVGVMLFYRVGEFFEHRAVERSRSQIMEAVDLRPETVSRMENGSPRVIPAEEAKVGDVLLVRPGDRIPLDGTVLSGTSRLDTAPITGEPVPVAVNPGDAVISGCVNTSGQLTVRVDRVLEESMVSRILSSVENAAASKPKMDRFITRFSRIYTPTVVIAAALTAVVPSLITGQWNYWIYTALSFLVMSCPCALVLSVPLAFFSGIGAGSKKGILFKGGLSIEAMAEIKAVVMDKTGTVTEGNFAVQQVEGSDEFLSILASCEQNSTHPIAQSIVSYAKNKGISLTAADSVEEIAGHGIVASLNGKTVLCGNEKLLASHGVSISEEKKDIGTRVYGAVDGQYMGFVSISDTLKEDAAETVRTLKKMGMAAVMLTGDEEKTAEAVGRKIGMDRVYARLLPEDKLTKLKELREEYGPVMFVGDGINDAPVISGADVGAAMGSGADAAIEAADAVFMTSQTSAVADALKIASQTKSIALQNVIFALAVKLLVMVLGLMGWASMWAAVFADSGVAMLCVLNSIRLLYGKNK